MTFIQPVADATTFIQHDGARDRTGENIPSIRQVHVEELGDLNTPRLAFLVAMRATLAAWPRPLSLDGIAIARFVITVCDRYRWWVYPEPGPINTAAAELREMLTKMIEEVV